jgi:hypothetical protein
MRVRAAAAAIALALTASAARPATLDAQRRQPVGIVRPVPALSQWGESCAAKKLMKVGRMSFGGLLLGLAATALLSAIATLDDEAEPPGPKFVFGGLALGLGTGLVVVYMQPCER